MRAFPPTAEVAALLKPRRLAVDLRVRHAPEVPDRPRNCLLEVIGRRLVELIDEAEDDVGRGRQIDAPYGTVRTVLSPIRSYLVIDDAKGLLLFHVALDRMAPLTGMAFLALLIASFIVGGAPPEVGDPPRTVVAFWRDHENAQIVAALLGGAAAVFLVWFGGVVQTRLRGSERGSGRLATTAFGGFVLAAAGGLALSGLQFTAAHTAGKVPAAVTQTLSVLNKDFFLLLDGGVVIVVFATAAAILRGGALPRWFGYLSLVVGVAFVTPAFVVAFPAFGAWMVVLSVLSLRGAPGADELRQ